MASLPLREAPFVETPLAEIGGLARSMPPKTGDLARARSYQRHFVFVCKLMGLWEI